MAALCPHCRNPMEQDPSISEEMVCATCGSSFRVERESTAAYVPGAQPLGKFELIEKVGMGAFGVVWKAQDPELSRVVAVKIPHPGRLVTSQDEQRFLREARSSAQLRHPNIASVHEVGRHDGVPFLVVEFIDGVTLADFLTARRLTFTEAAELLVQVAEALDYAHCMGVIHRDVKPSNIMIDRSPAHGTDLKSVLQGLGKPMIMDFGLALRHEAEATMTLDGQVLGTPAYMSPEQALGLSHKVDARSDIYSVGVVMYQLLTGELPFRGNSRMQLDQVLREEPRPPRKLNDKIPRDLETICLKALAKEPGRRYARARELADDLRRFLKGDPILARPVRLWERSLRWCRRNPVVAGLTAAVILVTVFGFAGVTWQWRKARANALLLAEANDQIEKERDQAQKNFQAARKAVDDYFTQVSESTLLQSDIPGLQPLRKELLERALKYYQDFLSQQKAGPADQEVREQTAAAYFRVGNITALIGKKPDALAAFRQSRDFYEELARAQPNQSALKNELAKNERRIGDLLTEMGEPHKALQAYHEAISLWIELIRAKSAIQEYKIELASGYRQMALAQRSAHQPSAAKDSFQEAIKLGKELVDSNPADSQLQRDLMESYSAFAHFQYVSGQLDQTQHARREAILLGEKLAKDHPNNSEFLDKLAEGYFTQAEEERNLNQPTNALRSFKNAIDIQAKLVRENPAVTSFRHHLARTLWSRGNLQCDQGLLEEGLKSGQQALEILEELINKDPSQKQFLSDLGATHLIIGKALRQKGRRAEALAAFQKSIPILENPSFEAGTKEYNLACARALCASVIGDEKKRSTPEETAQWTKYVDEAMDALRQAVKAGYANAEEMKTDPDLASLHERDDFQKLVKELEKKSRPTVNR